MAIGNPLSKAILDTFLQNQASWLLSVWEQASRMHQEALMLPTDAPTLTAMGYTANDVNDILAIFYQLDRVQSLLGGTVPSSATPILGDAAKVLQPGT